MDERVADLLDSYPQIFESKVPKTGDFDDEFVVINIPDISQSADGNQMTAFDSQIDLNDQLNEDEYQGSTLPAARDLIDNIATIGPWSWLRRNHASSSRLTDKIKKRIKGVFPGSPGGKPSSLSPFAPPPDAFAFYLPFHRYPEYWGIYLLDAGVQSFSLAIGAGLRSRDIDSVTAPELRTIATAFLYHHEAYHCAVEAFAIRSELPMRRPFYRTGLRKIYMREWTQGTPNEETLATAYALRKVRDKIKLHASVRSTILDVLVDYLRQCAPEYSAGVAYMDDAKFTLLEQQFKELATNANLSSKIVLAPETWQIGTFLMTPLIQRNRMYSWVCDRNDFRRRSNLAVHYFRRKDVIACLARVAATQELSGGRHKHLVREIHEYGSTTQRRTQVPSGEIKSGTLKKILKDLDLPMSLHEFRDQCRMAGEALS